MSAEVFDDLLTVGCRVNGAGADGPRRKVCLKERDVTAEAKRSRTGTTDPKPT